MARIQDITSIAIKHSLNGWSLVIREDGASAIKFLGDTFRPTQSEPENIQQEAEDYLDDNYPGWRDYEFYSN